MKHPFNQQLFSYWTERRGARDAPEHDDIDPGAIRGILGDSFELAYEAETGCSFRVAGTRLCALFGRELQGNPVREHVGCRERIGDPQPDRHRGG